MVIGLRAHDAAYAPFDQLVPNIKAQGFDCMHIALSKSVKEFTPDIAAMTPAFAMHMKRVCEKNDLDVAVLGCYLNLCNPDPVQHKQIVEKYEAHLRFASMLECGVVGTETGACNVEYKFGMLMSVLSQLLDGDVGIINVSDGNTAHFSPT